MRSSGKERLAAPAATGAPAPAGEPRAAKHGRGRQRRPARLSAQRVPPPRDALEGALLGAVDAVTVFDRDWRIVFINERSAELLGAPRESLLGRNLWEMYPGGAAGRAHEEFHRAIRDQVSVVFEQLSPHVGRVLQCHAMPTSDGLLLISRDVSDGSVKHRATTAPGPLPGVRRKVADLLQRSERRFRALIENSLDAVLMIDAQGRALYSSPRVFGADGILPGNVLGAELLARVHVDDVAAARRDVARLLAKPGSIVSACYRIQHPDGRWIWIEGVAHNRLRDPMLRAIVVNCRDVTEQRSAEEALRRSEHHFRSLIEGALDMVAVVDDAGNTLYASPSHERVIGWQPHEMLGRGALATVHPDDVAPLSRAFDAALAGEPSSTIEARVRHKDGSWRTIEVITHRSPHASPTGGFIVNARDVTERQAAERKTATLLEVARDLASTLDAAELLALVGRRVAAALGCELVSTYQWDHVRERYLPTSLHGMSPDEVAELANLPLAAGTSLASAIAHGPVVIENAGAGSDLRASISRRFGVTSFVAAPLRSSARFHGALIAATTSAERRFDATHAELLAAVATQLAIALERADLYRRQQQDAQLYGALARVGQDLLAGFDLPDLPERFCRVAAEVLGCDTAHTISWQPDDDVCAVVATHGTGLDAAEALRVLRIPRATLAAHCAGPGASTVAGEGAARDELPSILSIPAGARLLVIPLRRGDEVVGLQTAVRTEECGDFGDVELEIGGGLARLGSLVLEHARARAELGHANRLKSDFVAMISHELRTPLNVILGYSDLLLDETFGALQPAQAEVVQGIHASGHGLLQLIRDVLDLSRLDSGRIVLDMQAASVPELLAELAHGVRAQQHGTEVELVVEIDPRLGTLVTDPAKLGVALKNLLFNAFKFTSHGRVTLAARAEAGGVAFVVADTGIGIAPDHLDLIFEPFRQGDAALTRRHGGVGLGLYIVRRMVEMLGGTVRVESQLGHGSTFRVWLPGASDVPTADGQPQPAAGSPSSDAVTGLPSAVLLQDRLARALQRGEPEHGAAVLLLVDVDCACGGESELAPDTRNALLCMVGERLVAAVRMTDTVAHAGGGEFLLLLPGRASATAVREMAHTLLATLAVELLVGGVPHRIGTTIGAVVVHGASRGASEVIASARRAVRRAKGAGRAVVIVPG